MKIKKSNMIFIILVIVTAILKMLLVSNLPILSEASLGEDDELMVRLANSLVEGEWLGKYQTNTFLKGLTFPIFLSLIYFLHIRYVFAVSLLYVLACISFIYVMNKVIKNKIILFVLYISLLFHPIMSCYQVMQRVYRNSIVISLALFVMSGYINLYLIRDKSIKEKLPTIFGICLSFPMFWYTREDSMWIIPFIIFLNVFYIVLLKNGIQEKIKNIGILVLPIISLIIITNIISFTNYCVYGVYTVHDDACTKAQKSLVKVKANVEVEKVTNTREKLDRIAEISPAMQSIKKELDVLLDAYAKIDGGLSDIEVQNGWFGFAFIGAVKESGYYTSAVKSYEFYNTLSKEIEDAIANGTLERETRKKDYIAIFKETALHTIETIKYVFSYEGIDFNLENGATVYLLGYKEKYDNFLKITRDRNLFTEDSYDEEGKPLIKDIEEQREYIEKNQYKEIIIKKIIAIYKIVNKILFPIGAISYILMTIKFIMNLIKKNYENIDKWIITSSILGAIFTLMVGIAYCTTTTFDAISSLYLCATYPLFIAFSIISIYNYFSQINIEYITQKFRR